MYVEQIVENFKQKFSLFSFFFYIDTNISWSNWEITNTRGSRNLFESLS